MSVSGSHTWHLSSSGQSHQDKEKVSAMLSPVKTMESSLDMQKIQWCQQRRALLIDNRTISFTRTEYLLFAPLRSGKPITYTDLASSAYGCQLDTKVRVMMDKHIDRIRGKLRGSGVYIYCILGYGYVLLPETILPDD
jgi:DNA-binding response OmpR family regulator